MSLQSQQQSLLELPFLSVIIVHKFHAPCFDEINDIVDDIKALPPLKFLKKAIREKPKKNFEAKSKEGKKVIANTVIIRSSLTDFRKAKKEE